MDNRTLPRVLTRADARRHGFSDDAVDRRASSGRWPRVLPRTYPTAPTFTEHDRLDAALAFAGTGAALSGAAALYGAGVARAGAPGRVLVLVPSGNTAASAGYVQIRRSVRALIVDEWARPRRVPVTRAGADLAVTMRPLDDVRSLVARLMQGGHCTLAELGAELDAGPRRGSKHLRQALLEIGRGAASAPEAEAASVLRRAGVTGFVQNATVTLPHGATRVLDFYWTHLRACLEIDSVEYHFDRDEWTATMQRHLELTAAGYSVIHRPPSALRDADRFVSDVRGWLAGREADLRRGLSA